jgi:hypothetical protein|tara:strand:+ start:255 stop:707 length:453 start_codon:yes stop_codon:yes gene_type:complete
MVLIEDRRKDLIMTAKSVKKSTAKSVVKSAELVVTDRELEYNEIWAFVQEHAGGNEANVKIVPLDNVDLASATPVPFGYGGKTGGVRQVIQDWMLKGVDGDLSLKAVLNKAAPLGHSRKKPVCLHALMHGGYSPSSKYWMTPFVKLVVQG